MEEDEARRGEAAPGRRTRSHGEEPGASLAGLGTSPDAADDREAEAALRPAASANTIQITPFMHVRDLAAAVSFFEDVLGFETRFRLPDYAYLEREGAGLRILAYADAHVFEGGRDRFAYYIDVRDVDAVHAELKPRLDTLPPEDVHGPADKSYGQRELLIRAPDGQLVVFGAAIRS